MTKTQQFTSPLQSGDTIQRGKFTLTATVEHDYSHGAPWDECDGHGPVSDWRPTDSKAPGEVVLCDARNGRRGEARFYNMAQAVRIARRDGWGSLWPYTLRTERQRGGAWIARAVAPYWQRVRGELQDMQSKPRRDINRAISEVYDARKAQFPSARAYHANAAQADFERLRAWCNDKWSYVGVVVTASRNGIDLGSASLWGIESNAGDYLAETANELADEALTDARDAIAALTE